MTLAGAPPPLVTQSWIVLLAEPAVIDRYPGRIEHTRAASDPYRAHLRQVQENLTTQLRGRNLRVLGSVQHLMNAVFVRASPEEAQALKALPGVKAVLPSRRVYKLDQLTLSDVQGAWQASPIGGQTNAGAGLKIAILDTGIDQTHPSFQDSSLTAPSGFPKCDVSANCAFTSNKVIVARSYVSTLVSGSSPSDPAADDRPDDLSARDRTGHGTGVASVAAGAPVTANGISISGVAPKAFLGNYKIYGSPEINSYASDTGIIQALDDAVTDGMDVVNLSSGAPPFSGPLDTGAVCGNAAGQPCDASAYAVEQAVSKGQVLVVVAAGNSGSDGYRANATPFGPPTFGTVSSPADAPSAVAAGGLENDITYSNSVEISGTGVPANLAQLDAFPSADGPQPTAPLTAPLVDVTTVGNSDGLLCSGVAVNSLLHDIALIQRGTCDFATKVANAEAAGALGVLFINNGNPIVGWGGLSATQIPALMISQSDGASLKTFLAAAPATTATLDVNTRQISATDAGFIPRSVTPFSSRGPALGSYGLKPDVSAVATDFLLAAQNFDPFGDLYSSRRYTAADGTSFSTPMVSGAAALVKQAQPGLTPLQLKSAVVNTATLSGVLSQDGSTSASITEVGAGLLQAQNAVLSTVQIVPSAVSFGLLSGALPGTQTLTLSNTGTSSVNLSITVAQPSLLAGAQVLVNNAASTNVALAAGQTSSLRVSVSGAVPGPGRYDGLIALSGGPVPLHIPYMFVVGDGSPYDIVPIYGQAFDGPINQQLPVGEGPLIVRVIDQYGVAVPNANVQWAVTRGGGTVLQGNQLTSTTTDDNGLAVATVSLGAALGSQEFTATVNGLTLRFDGNARIQPAISANGIVDAASFTSGRAVAPGSLVSVFGVGLADSTTSASKLPLPLGLDGIAFSFDALQAGVSVPANFYFASPGQLNIQVPWELAGQSEATVKAIVQFTYSGEYIVPLATYAPGIFANTVGGQPIAAALDQNSKIVSASNPAAGGSTVQLFLNGLGPVNNQPASGYPGPADGSATTKATPSCSIGGQAAAISFSGLAPNFVGLYQVNAVVPQGLAPGMQPLLCSIGGVSSSSVFLPVQ